MLEFGGMRIFKIGGVLILSEMRKTHKESVNVRKKDELLYKRVFNKLDSTARIAIKKIMKKKAAL